MARATPGAYIASQFVSNLQMQSEPVYIISLMGQFEESDVERLLSLLATAADPAVQKPISGRRRDLLKGMQAFLGADAWLWFSGELRSDDEENQRTSSLLYDGFKGQEPSRVFQNVGLPAIRSLFMPGDDDHHDRHARQIIPLSGHRSGKSPALSLPAIRCALAANHCIVARCQPHDQTYVGVIFRRKNKKRAAPFTQRELSLLNLLFENVNWLNSSEMDAPASDALESLSPREQQVLLLLLDGKSPKEAAKELGLSAHTVTDYLKQIYSKLEVNSRGELLARFISSGSPPSA